jgi:hypothetical protein
MQTLPKDKPFTLAGEEYEIKEGFLNLLGSKNLTGLEYLQNSTLQTLRAKMTT